MAARETRRVSFAKVAVINEFSVTASSSEGESTVPSIGSVSALGSELRGLLTAPIINDCRSSDNPAEICSEKTEQIGPRRPSQNKRAPLQPIAVPPEDCYPDKENIQVEFTTPLVKTMVFNEDMSLNTLCTSIWPEDETEVSIPTNKTLIYNNDIDIDMTATFTSNISLCQPVNKTVAFQDVNMNTEMTDQVEVAITDPDVHRNSLLSQLKAMTLKFPTNVTKPDMAPWHVNEMPLTEDFKNNSSAPLKQVDVMEPITEMTQVTQVDDKSIVWDISSSEQKRPTSSSSRFSSKMDTQQTIDKTYTKSIVIPDSCHDGLQLASVLNDSPSHEALHEIVQFRKATETEKVQIEGMKVVDLNISSLTRQHTEVKSQDLTESIARDRSASDRPRSDIDIGKKPKAFGVRNSVLNRLKAAQRLSTIDSGNEDTTTKYGFLAQTQSKNTFDEMQPVIGNQTYTSLAAVSTIIPQVTKSLNEDMNEKPPTANSPPIICAQNSYASSLKRPTNTKSLSPPKRTRNLQKGFTGFEESFQDEDLIDNQNLELVGDYSPISSSAGISRSMCKDINTSLDLGKRCVKLETMNKGADEEMEDEPEICCTSECGSSDETIDLIEISNMLDMCDEVENMCDKLIQALPPSELLDQIENIDKEIAEAEAGVAEKFAKLDELLEGRKRIYKKKVSVKQTLKMTEKEIRELEQSQSTHDFMIRKLNIDALLKRQYYEWTLDKLTPQEFVASFMWNTFTFRVTFGEDVKGVKIPPNCVCKHVICMELVPNPEGLNELDNIFKLVYGVVWEILQDKRASWKCLTTRELPDVLDEISTVVGRARIVRKDIIHILSFEELSTRDGTKIDFTPSKMYLCNFLVNLTALPTKLEDYKPLAVNMLRSCVRDEILSDSFITAEERSLYHSRISKSMNAYFKNLGDYC